jgi:dTDP-4-amino-4,6-dideoxygalactose transaminase
MIVPFLDLKEQNLEIKNEVLAVWEDILESSQFIGGQHILGFEDEFSSACNSKYCTAVSSGTCALRLIFCSLDLKPGDEVITVPNTFIATAEAITQAGGRATFVDIDPNRYTLCPKSLSTYLNSLSPENKSKIKGIVPVHLYGQMADMDKIMSIANEHGLWVVEDACQAHLADYKGRKAGSYGVASAFSFYPSKNLGAAGEAGAIVTNNKEIHKKVRMLQDHGQTKKYIHEVEGFNGRCDALQGALLRIKLKYLEKWNNMRRESAKIYLNLLKDLTEIKLPSVYNDSRHVYHLFVIQTDNRETVMKTLQENGISSGLHYPIPLNLQSAYSYLGLPKGSFPIAEKSAERILSLPMYPGLKKTQIEYVCEILRKIIKE